MLVKKEDKGEEVKALDRIPDLYPGLEHIYSTFLQLSVRRPIGMERGFIPIAEMVSYLDMLEIKSSSIRMDYFEHWCKLDVAYMGLRKK